MELLFKTCGKNNVAGTGFEQRRDTAFGVMQNGVVQGHGFYATTYESVYVLGQCEGDIGDSDCSGCIKNALQRAQVECGSSISGQIYLHKCFVGYSFYPNGVPKRSSPYPSSGSSGSSSSSSSSGENFYFFLFVYYFGGKFQYQRSNICWKILKRCSLKRKWFDVEVNN